MENRPSPSIDQVPRAADPEYRGEHEYGSALSPLPRKKGFRRIDGSHPLSNRVIICVVAFSVIACLAALCTGLARGGATSLLYVYDPPPSFEPGGDTLRSMHNCPLQDWVNNALVPSVLGLTLGFPMSLAFYGRTAWAWIVLIVLIGASVLPTAATEVARAWLRVLNDVFGTSSTGPSRTPGRTASRVKLTAVRIEMLLYTTAGSWATGLFAFHVYIAIVMLRGTFARHVSC